METATIPTITMANDRENGFNSSQLQSSTLNPVDAATVKLNSVLVDQRSVPPAGENKIPFIGDVHEDNMVTSSWIFPTASLTKSKSSQDIPFLPPVENNGVAMMATDVPPDGSFVGDKKGTKILHASLTEEKDIPFVPTEVESNGGGVDTSPPRSVDLTPREGTFVTHRIPPIAKTSSSDSRDIDFSPAGSGMETAAPPLDGSFLEDRSGCCLANMSSHDIDVVPDLAGRDMPTSPPPKEGTFSGRSDVNQAMKMQEAVVARTDREINFSPGACEMATGPPPFSGSYNRGQQGSPMRGTSGHPAEIHVLPEDIGTSLVVTPPRAGRYAKKIKEDEDGVSPARNTASPREQTHNMKDNKLEKDPPMDVSDSWIFPQLEQDEEQEDIIFSAAGGSSSDTPISPLQGSFSEGPHTSSLIDSSSHHREIHVTPDLTGKHMPTAPPPNDGSFSGKLDFTNEENEEAIPDDLPSEGQHQAMVSTMGEIDVNCPDTLVDPIELAAIRGDLALSNGNESDNRRSKTDVDDGDDEEEDDPMKDDQDLWRAKRAWDLAKLKQSSLRAIEAANESGPGTGDGHAQVIIDGERLDSNPLADSIHKIGALLGSAYDMKPVDSHDEETDMSNSIQKVGALLGSTHLDDQAHDKLDDPLRVETIETTSPDDILDDLLGDEEVMGDGDADVSHAESIVDLCSLPEFNKSSDSRVHDDDVTVQIENKTKHSHLNEAAENVSNVDVSTAREGTLSDDLLHPSLPVEMSNPVDIPDEYPPDNEMATLEALLEKELETSLRDFGKTSDSLGHRSRDEDAARDEEVNEANKSRPTREGHREDDSYVPTDSIAMLEALLDKALDSPIERENTRTFTGASPDDESDHSVNSLDDFLDKALDSDVEITFEPTEDEIKAPVKNIPAIEKPKEVPNGQKAAASRSRISVPRRDAAEGKSRQRARVDQFKTAQDPPPNKKPALPKFRLAQKTSKPVEKVTNAAPAPKEPVPRFGRLKAVPNYVKTSFKGTSISAPDDGVGVATNSQNQATLTRTRKIISRFRPWTKRTTDSANALFQGADDCHVPMYTPAESRNKGIATPVRLFTSTKNSAQRIDNNGSSSKSINPKVTHNRKTSSNNHPYNEGAKTQKIQLTNLAALPKRSNLYALSSLARSTTSLSSTCSVTDFRSPRREGIRGCQHKFDPYLHDVRGPCELCVFFLSDQDRAALDAQGRHVRVMFTTGGCCRTCAIFPRSFDDQPARLCRMCYSNSHRLLHDSKSSKRGRQEVLAAHKLSNQDESSSDIL